jgi:hypothetical protein
MPLASPMPPRGVQDANRNIACASQRRASSKTDGHDVGHPYKVAILKIVISSSAAKWRFEHEDAVWSAPLAWIDRRVTPSPQAWRLDACEPAR